MSDVPSALTLRGNLWLAVQAVMSTPAAMAHLHPDHSLVNKYVAADGNRGLELQVVQEGAPELELFVQGSHNTSCDSAPYNGDPLGLELTYRTVGGAFPCLLVERNAPHEQFLIIVWPVGAFLGYEDVRNLILAEFQPDAEQAGVA